MCQSMGALPARRRLHPFDCNIAVVDLITRLVPSEGEALTLQL